MDLSYILLMIIFSLIFITPFMIKCHPDSWLRGVQKLYQVHEKREKRKETRVIHVETPGNRKRVRPELEAEETWQSKNKSEFAQRLREERLISQPKRKKHKSPLKKQKIRGR
jgi:hypothetical protein